MTVRVRLFAGLRERAGWSEREIDAASVGDVWPRSGSATSRRACSTR